MGFLSVILSKVGLGFVEKLIDGGTHLFEAYLNKQITVEELRTKLLGVVMSSAVDIEKSHAEAITAGFHDFMEAAQKSKLMQAVWASVALSQLFVLLWHQLAIPFIAFHYGVHYPPSGSTVDWAYALVMFCMGGGAIALRMGPGSTSVIDQLKSLIARK